MQASRPCRPEPAQFIFVQPYVLVDFFIFMSWAQGIRRTNDDAASKVLFRDCEWE